MPDGYISREAALEDFESCNAENPNWTPTRVKTLLLRQPAADVAEVVHAKWIPFHSEAAGDIQYCSACDIGFDARMDYCPHCGRVWTAGRRTQTMESEKLVSADGLREWLKKIPLHDLSDGRGLCRIIFAEDFERAMASFPGDAIQIVRCKDCKWFADNNGGEWYGCKMFHVVRITPEDAPKPDDFCSYGERREE